MPRDAGARDAARCRGDSRGECGVRRAARHRLSLAATRTAGSHRCPMRVPTRANRERAHGRVNAAAERPVCGLCAGAGVCDAARRGHVSLQSAHHVSDSCGVPPSAGAPRAAHASDVCGAALHCHAAECGVDVGHHGAQRAALRRPRQTVCRARSVQSLRRRVDDRGARVVGPGAPPHHHRVSSPPHRA